MEPDQTEKQHLLEDFLENCRRVGIRATHQRIAIFLAVAGSTDHPDVETVFSAVRKTIPTISLDTVYRTLWLLRDLGLVSTLGPPREKTRFDANTSPHHHFVCSSCGRAVDFYSREFDALTAPEFLEDVGRVEAVHVELRGVCSSCCNMCNDGAENAAGRQGGRR